MIPQLTEELRQAVAQRHGEPLQVEDPVTHDRYVLVRLPVFERLQQAAEYDASEPDPREFYSAFAHAVQDELDAPCQTSYDEADATGTQP
jgi:hypothetical protein